MTIQKEAINKQFKCGVCAKDHYIPDDGFVIDETKYALISSEPMEISRGNEYELLNLNKIQSITKLLWSDYENGTNIIREYCYEQN